MRNLKFETTEGEPPTEDFKALSDGLLSHHASQGHTRTWKKFCIFLKDEVGTAYAGIIVTFTWNGMQINSLWVEESLRGQDYGTKLIEMAEDKARRRGCTIAFTDTFSWQAQGFYEKLGYKLYGKLEGFPEGNALNYYSKKLN
ncbi:MAG: GNAT family N-acetyltransferase [Candidatus Levybacteria bacterium]|nr:GNAT family N-acetyltransferase [Candidatus Levybacteria bacterium]